MKMKRPPVPPGSTAMLRALKDALSGHPTPTLVYCATVAELWTREAIRQEGLWAKNDNAAWERACAARGHAYEWREYGRMKP